MYDMSLSRRFERWTYDHVYAKRETLVLFFSIEPISHLQVQCRLELYRWNNDIGRDGEK